MAKIINLNEKREFTDEQFVNFMTTRDNFINYGIWLGKNGFKDTIMNYEKYLDSEEYLMMFS
ncbi:MAG: hypothetical protein ACRC28_08560 [Clostridium sp.]|uniref:hypothetical protein n=1 Tax=Clostridia TaxID=186801 RepID=UPI003F3CDD5B